MMKWIAGTIGIVLIVALAVAALNRPAGGSAQGGAEAAPEPTVLADARVIAEGRLVPVSSVELRFPSGGTVAELLVKEGDQVAAGAPLARLDARELELRVAQAQADLDQARADYDDQKAGATPAEIAAAQAQIERSNAQLRAARGGVTSGDISAARAHLDEARARLAQLSAGPRSAERQAAQARLDQAQAKLRSERDRLSAAKTSAAAELEKAANLLRDKQEAYDRIYWENQRAAGQIAAGGAEAQQEAQSREAAAQREMQNAAQDLAQAQVALDSARQAEISGVAEAEAGVRESQANLSQLLSGSTADQIAAARAAVAQAEADYAKLTGDQRAGNLEAAEADQAIAQAELERLSAGPRATRLAVAQAKVARAEVVLKQAQLARDQATLVSPIDGTVVLLNLKVGEAVGAADVAVVAADLSQWQIETTDLSELKVAQVPLGATAEISFDALPDLKLGGTVARIKQRGENQRGEITYTAIIALKQADPRLRWNMTASVAIPTK